MQSYEDDKVKWEREKCVSEYSRERKTAGARSWETALQIWTSLMLLQGISGLKDACVLPAV